MSRQPEQLLVTAPSRAADSRIWIGPGLLDAAGERLFSPSGRFLIVAPPAAAAARDRIARALAGRVLADVALDDREEAKTGVDHSAGKNLLGAFHPPRTVLVDPEAAAGLPERDFRAGLVEALKAAWIADAALASRAAASLDRVLARDEEALLDLVAGAARIKADIVASDPREESGRRRLLNFGHTLGHALEAAGGYRDLRHGEAVAWGIAAAVEISERRAGLAKSDAEAIRGVLARLGPFPEPVREPARLEAYLQRDKKASAAGTPAVLLETIGRGRVEEAVPASEWLSAAAIMSLK